MKSQVSPAGPAATLSFRSWARFSPTTVIPASASAGSSSSGTYLTAARISTSPGSRPAPAIASRTRSRLVSTAPPSARGRARPSQSLLVNARTRSAISTRQPGHARLAAGDAAVAPVGEEQRRSRADRAHSDVVDLAGVHPGALRARTRDRLQVQIGPPCTRSGCRANASCTSRRPRSSRPRRPGPIAARSGPAAPSSRSPSTPAAITPPARPRQPRVQHRHGAVAGDRDRQAIGGQRGRGQPRLHGAPGRRLGSTHRLTRRGRRQRSAR